MGRSTLKKFMKGHLLWVAPHTETGEQHEEERAWDNARWTGCNPHSPFPCASPGGGERIIGGEAEPKKRDGLVLFGMEIIFSIDALMVLCFGFVSKTQILEQCFTYCCTSKYFLPLTLPLWWGEWGAQEIETWHSGDSWPQQIVPHHVCHTQCINLGEGGIFSVMLFVFPCQCYTWWSPAFLRTAAGT